MLLLGGDRHSTKSLQKKRPTVVTISVELAPRLAQVDDGIIPPCGNTSCEHVHPKGVRISSSLEQSTDVEC
jgi:hypothetical protein